MPPLVGANLLQDPAFQWASGLLIGVLLIGAVALAVLDRWKDRQLSNSSHEPAESFGSFRKMYERGELSEGEYQAIRDKMARRIKAGGPAPEAVGPVPEGIAEPPASGDDSAGPGGRAG